MKLMKTEDYHEDLGPVIFIAWGRDDNGVIQGEPPELNFCFGYLEDGFDSEHYTHFIGAEFFNDLFTQADPKLFPPM